MHDVELTDQAGHPWRLSEALGRGAVALVSASQSTCRRRLRDWQQAGVWDRLRRTLLDRLGDADRIDSDRREPRQMPDMLGD